jgi:hypothetical protein
MPNTTSSNLIRLTAPLLALWLAGAALAEPRGGGDQARADCYSQASLQLSVDMAQCAAYPAGSAAYSDCQAEAAQRYSQALVQCDINSPAIRTGSSLSARPLRPVTTPGTAIGGLKLPGATPTRLSVVMPTGARQRR